MSDWEAKALEIVLQYGAGNEAPVLALSKDQWTEIVEHFYHSSRRDRRRRWTQVSASTGTALE
jgi:hypothetical protein